MTTYKTEARALRRALTLAKRYGVWPGCIRKSNGDQVYWVLSFDPDASEFVHR
jgi:hypothetical protein